MVIERSSTLTLLPLGVISVVPNEILMQIWGDEPITNNM
ncbi:hypothetical protein J5U22_01803 [Saccharolobus shibatae]|uniref:Uncharacterized protein n=1 Tax=Saccharolobus shibatae TaxID=2286 RepID=A0A8F5C1H4_9CREN|nr:hypothetical protein J5U22_01803 [Saccharolobus shibatae]